MELKRHAIWEVFPGTDTLEDFQKNFVHPFQLKPEVPVDVKESMATVEKLLLFSYYEYNLIDIAVTQAIFVFEKALRIRIKELNISPQPNRFQKLIDWFNDHGYFETWSKWSLHQLRSIRNGKVHEDSNTLGGIAFLRKTYTAVDFINDLYEDPKLRKTRKDELTILTKSFEELLEAGGILTYQNNRRIVHKAWPVFLNNKSAQHVLTISVCPIFDPSQCSETGASPGHAILSLTNWNITADGFTGYDINTGEEITLKKISDEPNHLNYASWWDELSSQPNFTILLYLMVEPLEDLFISSLREFHKIK